MTTTTDLTPAERRSEAARQAHVTRKHIRAGYRAADTKRWKEITALRVENRALRAALAAVVAACDGVQHAAPPGALFDAVEAARNLL